MRSLRTILCLMVLLGCSVHLHAGTGRILKLLPHYLDQQGLHTLSPSLYERDAYQAELRKNPELRSGVRFDVQWKSIEADRSKLKLRIELRSSGSGSGKPVVLEEAVKPNGWFSNWSSITLTGEAYDNLGEIIAWRATLWEGDRQLAEKKSFLW